MSERQPIPDKHRSGRTKIVLMVLILVLFGVIIFQRVGGTGRTSVLPQKSDSIEAFRATLTKLENGIESLRKQRRLSNDVEWQDIASRLAKEWNEPEPPAPPPDADTESTALAAPELQPKPERAPPVEERVKPLRLVGVAWNATRPLAFVNDRMLTLNDTIEGLKVVEVQPRAIQLEDEEGNRIRIRLYETLEPHVQQIP